MTDFQLVAVILTMTTAVAYDWTRREHSAIVAAMHKWLGLVALVGACSLTGIHYPDRAAQPIDCERLKLLPVLDTAAAAGAIGTSAYVYNEQTKSTPWPVSSLIVAAWAIASASYGYYETAHCRCQARQVSESGTMALGLNQP